MTTPISHSAIANEGLAARFVAGTLTGDSTERFDAHLLECPQCQAEVALALKIRAVGVDALRGGASPGSAHPARRWTVPLVAAAAVALFIFAPIRGDRAALRSLGAVPTAPVYLGVAVRSDAGTDAGFDADFDAAMALYERESWREALAALQSLADRSDVGDGLAQVRFFAGATALMLDRPERAEEEFAAVLALPESPYHAEARFYRGKAFLRLGRGTDAVRELRAVGDVELAARAAALADSVEDLRTR
jgi:TolA-binding protein